MHILISNDDGIFADGIHQLADTLSDIAQITVVAPDRNRSGASNSLTLENPLRVREVAPARYAVLGTPTDSVHLALNSILTENIDLVVTGINHGANLGDDVLYSGTVAAATEGFFMGIPAIAVSLCGHTHFDTAANVIKTLIQQNVMETLGNKHVLNVNVPDCPHEELKGFQATRLGSRHRSEGIIQADDPRGQPIYWIGPPGKTDDAGEGTDFHAIKHGYVSLTPLHVDLTAHEGIDNLSTWLTHTTEG